MATEQFNKFRNRTVVEQYSRANLVQISITWLSPMADWQLILIFLRPSRLSSHVSYLAS